MHLADVQSGVGKHQIERGRGHAGGGVVEMAMGHDDQSDDDSQVAQPGKAAPQPGGGIEPFAGDFLNVALPADRGAGTVDPLGHRP